MNMVPEVSKDSGPIALLRALDSFGAALIPAFSHDSSGDDVYTLGASLGSPCGATLTNPVRPYVDRIAWHDRPVVDKDGRVVLSTTAGELPLHTDEALAKEPSRYVLQHCVYSAPSPQGASTLACIDDILKELPSSDVSILMGEPVRFGANMDFILTQRGARTQVRFNRYHLLSPIADFLKPSVERFCEIADRCSFVVPVCSGDCLIIDNTRVMHGRTAFHPSSGRLLLRIRVSP